MLNYDDYTIVSIYGARYRGIVQYCLLAGDVFRLNRLHWVMQSSLLCSLANKHRPCRRWPASTRSPSTPRPGLASVSRPASPAPRAGNR
ncbi:group II intron reverse transcriptase/maturase [Streptomyces sp. NPDC004629]|uniref:group II intron reverse transcriptase/maturase n=1 Tax=Streptomyces sp. NPDC004629 TaxID=3364705 RepID=UPI0036CF8DF1